jgi:uncharacterized membrane protein
MKSNITESVKAEQGNVLVMVAVALVALLLMTALVIDVGNLLYRRVHLQNATDAAALAAATEGKKADGYPPDQDAMEKVAIEYIELHGLKANDYELDFTFLVNEPSTTTVTVILSAEEPLFFGPIVNIDCWSLKVQASAAWFDQPHFTGVRLVGQEP